jgi:hypothetical protein
MQGKLHVGFDVGSTRAVHDQGLLGRLSTTVAVADSRRLTSRRTNGLASAAASDVALAQQTAAATSEPVAPGVCLLGARPASRESM